MRLNPIKFLVIGTTLGFFLSILTIAIFGIKTESADLLKTLMITLSNGFTMILGYYFGSSDSSARKTELMNPKPTNTPPPQGE